MTENKNSKPEPIDLMKLKPALRQIGITPCLICKNKVAVLMTKMDRPFVNCSFCSARIFYNGRESMRLLKKTMTPTED
jgi:DNA-directed RNA polymerase subunit RPC12/RpoP